MITGTIKPERSLEHVGCKDDLCDYATDPTRLYATFQLTQKQVAASHQLLESSGFSLLDVAAAIEDLFLTPATTWPNSNVIHNPLYWLETNGGSMCPGCMFSPTPGCYGLPNITEIAIVNRDKERKFKRIYGGKEGISQTEYEQIIQNDVALIFTDIDAHLIQCHGIFRKELPVEMTVRYLGLKPLQ